MDGENEVQKSEVICQCVSGGVGGLNPCDLVPESRLLITRPTTTGGTIRKKERRDHWKYLWPVTPCPLFTCSIITIGEVVP